MKKRGIDWAPLLITGCFALVLLGICIIWFHPTAQAKREPKTTKAFAIPAAIIKQSPMEQWEIPANNIEQRRQLIGMILFFTAVGAAEYKRSKTMRRFYRE